ncbi:hypothetical protein DFJ74DRAFT_644619 [Hyaloraphidium curvatum]|nr:hypothetical protein DFJ74DRAFT_644619 [Hyaloraphidium curvatum]
MAAALAARPVERYSKDSLHDLGSPPPHLTAGYQNNTDPFVGMRRTAKGVVIDTEDGERLVSARDSYSSLASEVVQRPTRPKPKRTSPPKAVSTRAARSAEDEDESALREAEARAAEELQQNRQAHDKEVAALNGTIAKLRQELQDKVEQHAQLSTRLLQAQQTANDAEAAGTNALSSLRQLSTQQAATISNLTTTIGSLEERLEEQISRAAVAGKELERARQREDEVAEALGMNDAAVDHDSLVQLAEATRKERDRLHKEIGRVKTELADALSEVEHGSEKLAAAARKTMEAEAAAAARIEHLAEECSALKEENKGLAAQIATLNTAHQAALAGKATLTNRVDSLMQSLEESRAKFSDAEACHARRVAELREAHSGDVARLVKHIANLKGLAAEERGDFDRERNRWNMERCRYQLERSKYVQARFGTSAGCGCDVCDCGCDL